VPYHDPAIAAEARPRLSGLEFLSAILEGRLPPAPIANLLGFWPTEVSEGRVVFVGRPDASTYNPIGMVHGGFVCTLADTVTACAVHSTLPVGVGYTSLDLSVRYHRPLTIESGEVTAIGTLVKPGRKVAVAEAQILDGRGKLVATASSSCLILPDSPGDLPTL
jgi:uncharacterized protein (TIGR00369 family)